MNEEKLKEIANPNKVSRAREFLQQGEKDKIYGDNEYYRKGFLDGGLYADEHPNVDYPVIVIEPSKFNMSKEELLEELKNWKGKLKTEDTLKGWIPIEKETPTDAEGCSGDTQKMFVCNIFEGWIDIAIYNVYHKDWTTAFGTIKPTHWMPRPKLPKRDLL